MTLHPDASLNAATLPETGLGARLEALRAEAAQRVGQLPAPFPAVVLGLAVSDGEARACVSQGQGEDFDTAWAQLMAAFAPMMARLGLRGDHLRIDWVTGAETLSWGGLRQRLSRIKRNHFRKGLGFDTGLERMVFEHELNGQAMLYGGHAVAHAAVNAINIRAGIEAKYGPAARIDMADTAEVYLLDSAGLYCGADGQLYALNDTQTGLNAGGIRDGDQARAAGRRDPGPLTPALLRQITSSAARHLAGEMGADGRFAYGHHACFDRPILAQNALRHGVSVLALLDAYALLQDPQLLVAAERGLQHLERDLIRLQGEDLAFVVDTGAEVKLGANAAALLAFARHADLTGDGSRQALMRRLGNGILHMQAEDGSFLHVLAWPGLQVVDAFRVIHYEGQAALALLRLHALDSDPRWIDAVERAFTRFQAAEFWQFHDHWLAQACAALLVERPELRWARLGIQNVLAHVDFIGQRLSANPALLDLAVASRAMITRLAGLPGGAELIEAGDLARLERALHARADQLLNAHGWPELAMFFARPQRLIGSFFARHQAFRSRIDDVAGHVSALIGYCELLEAGVLSQGAPFVDHRDPEADPAGLLILSYPDNPRSFTEARSLAAEAHARGLKVHYASYDGLELVDGRIEGHVFNGETWRRGRFNVPALIDNAPPRRRSENELLERLGRGRHISSQRLGSKERILSILGSDIRARDWLIPSQPLSLEALLASFARGEERLIMKPLRADRGRAVHLIERQDDGRVSIRDNFNTLVLEMDELRDFLAPRPGERWILQPHLRSQDGEGHAFDIRVPLFRGGTGAWSAARIHARQGAGAVTASLMGGGTSHDADAFLGAMHGPDKAARLIAAMTEAACTIAEVLQEHYPHRLESLGFSFGVAEGRIWLFEVAAHPGIKACLESATVLRADYFAHLARGLGADLVPPQPAAPELPPVPQLPALSEAFRASLQAVADRGANDFTASGYLRQSGANPVYALLRHEARARGLEIRIIANDHLELLRDEHVVAVFSPNAPDRTVAVQELTADPALAHAMLAREGLGVVAGQVVTDLGGMRAFMGQHPGPVRLRARRGGEASVTLSEGADDAALAAALRMLDRGDGSAYIEAAPEGDTLRLIVLDGRLVAATVDLPAMVVGDGRQNLEQLIAARNLARESNPLTRGLSIGQLDHPDVLGMALDHIPEAGRSLRLTEGRGPEVGGEVISLLDQLHVSFHVLAARAFGALPGATLIGIDLVLRDPGAEAEEDNAVITGLSSDPSIAGPSFPLWGQPAADLAGALIEHALTCEVQITLPEPELDPAELLAPGNDAPQERVALLRAAALARDVITEDLSDQVTLIDTEDGLRILHGAMPDTSTAAARRISGDLQWCDRVLAELGLPVPRRRVFGPGELAEAQTFAQDIATPVTVSRARRGRIDRASEPVEAGEALAQAFERMAERSRRILVGEALPDSRQRLFVVGGRVVAALELEADGAGVDVTELTDPLWTGVAQTIVPRLFWPEVFEIALAGADLLSPPAQGGWCVTGIDLDPELQPYHAPSAGEGRDVAGAIIACIARV